VGSPSYQYQDSYAPGISYSWVPTTTASTKLAITQGNNNDGYGSLPLGFTFSFFDHTYNNVFASTNGLVMFNQAGSIQFNNQAIPTPGTVDNYATCFWDDQIINSTAQGIWSETFGVAPNRYTVITFVLQDADPNAVLPYRYQMILYENGGWIKCQYEDMGGSINGDGSSATIGLEGRYGLSGVQYFYNRQSAPLIGPIEDGLAVEFHKLTTILLPILRR
jgi:hypothetical protein